MSSEGYENEKDMNFSVFDRNVPYNLSTTSSVLNDSASTEPGDIDSLPQRGFSFSGSINSGSVSMANFKADYNKLLREISSKDYNEKTLREKQSCRFIPILSYFGCRKESSFLKFYQKSIRMHILVDILVLVYFFIDFFGNFGRTENPRGNVLCYVKLGFYCIVVFLRIIYWMMFFLSCCLPKNGTIKIGSNVYENVDSIFEIIMFMFALVIQLLITLFVLSFEYFSCEYLVLSPKPAMFMGLILAYQPYSLVIFTFVVPYIFSTTTNLILNIVFTYWKTEMFFVYNLQIFFVFVFCIILTRYVEKQYRILFLIRDKEKDLMEDLAEKKKTNNELAMKLVPRQFLKECFGDYLQNGFFIKKLEDVTIFNCYVDLGKAHRSEKELVQTANILADIVESTFKTHFELLNPIHTSQWCGFTTNPVQNSFSSAFEVIEIMEGQRKSDIFDGTLIRVSLCFGESFITCIGKNMVFCGGLGKVSVLSDYLIEHCPKDHVIVNEEAYVRMKNIVDLVESKTVSHPSYEKTIKCYVIKKGSRKKYKKNISRRQVLKPSSLTSRDSEPNLLRGIRIKKSKIQRIYAFIRSLQTCQVKFGKDSLNYYIRRKYYSRKVLCEFVLWSTFISIFVFLLHSLCGGFELYEEKFFYGAMWVWILHPIVGSMLFILVITYLFLFWIKMSYCVCGLIIFMHLSMEITLNFVLLPLSVFYFYQDSFFMSSFFFYVIWYSSFYIYDLSMLNMFLPCSMGCMFFVLLISMFIFEFAFQRYYVIFPDLVIYLIVLLLLWIGGYRLSSINQKNYKLRDSQIKVVEGILREKEIHEILGLKLVGNRFYKRILKGVSGDFSFEHDRATVLQIKFGGLQGYCLQSSSSQVKNLGIFLNCVVTSFDEKMEQLKLEKIKYVGSEFVCFSSGEDDMHAERILTGIQHLKKVFDEIYEDKHDLVGKLVDIHPRFCFHTGHLGFHMVGINKLSFDLTGTEMKTVLRRLGDKCMEDEILATEISIGLLRYRRKKFKNTGYLVHFDENSQYKVYSSTSFD